MKTITIYRKEMTTYTETVVLSDEEADQLLDFPELHTQRLMELCDTNASTWMDAEEPDFEVKEEE